MATQIPDQFPIQFDTSFMSEYQQKGSRLAALAGVVKPGKGEFIRFNKILKRTAHEITERGGDTIYANDSFENRILFPRAAEDAVLRPEFDMASLEDIVLPNSQEVQEMAQAIGRIEDSFVISALTGSSYEGTTSPSVVPYDSGQAIAVNFGGSSVGLTYQKVSQAKYMFEKNEVDDGSLYLLVSAKQMQDLRNDIIANHADDYSSYTAAQAGDLKSLFGFQFVRTELLARNTSTDVRTCIAFSSKALAKATWNDRKTDMDFLPEKRHSLAIRTRFRTGYARIWDAGVITIACDESP